MARKHRQNEPEKKNVFALKRFYLDYLDKKEIQDDPDIESKAQKEFDDIYASLQEAAKKGERVIYIQDTNKPLPRTQRKLDAAGFVVYNSSNNLLFTIRW